MRYLAYALLAIAGSSAFAADAVIAGAGSASCGQALEISKNSSGKLQITQWVYGYVSAYNRRSSGDIKPPDADAVAAYVVRYCTDNPLAFLYTSVDALIADLERSQKNTP